MTNRETFMYNVLKEIWGDVESVSEVTEDMFHAVIPRGIIHMNNLLELQAKLAWNDPFFGIRFLEPNKVELEINFI